MTRFLREAWERFVLYLPLIAMATLALASYWLVRTSPASTEAPEIKAAGHVPDYFMHDFMTKRFASNGAFNLLLAGKLGQHFPSEQLLEVEGVRVRFINPQGHETTAVADHGSVNDAATLYTLEHEALITRTAWNEPNGKHEPQAQLRGEELLIDTKKDRASSSKRVELVRGEDHLSGDAMEMDNASRTLQLHGRVKAVLHPRPKL